VGAGVCVGGLFVVLFCVDVGSCGDGSGAFGVDVYGVMMLGIYVGVCVGVVVMLVLVLV